MNEQNFETNDFKIVEEPSITVEERPNPPTGRAVKTMVFGIISTMFGGFPALGGFFLLMFSLMARMMQSNPAEMSGSDPISMIVTGWSYGIMFLGYGIVALVFAIIARKQSLPIVNDYPYTAARKLAKVGRITSTVGLISSIVSLSAFGLCVLGAISFMIV